MRFLPPGFIRLVIILSLCTLLITLDGLGFFKARYILNYLFTPLERLAGALHSIQNAQKQLAELSAESASKDETSVEPELSQENALLRQLLGIPFSLPFAMLPASVIDSTTQLGKHYIVIDQGSLSGASPGQTVVSGKYFIGQIDQVGLAESTVKLLGADSLYVAVYLPRSGFPGILRARSDGVLEVYYLPPRAKIKVGDLVYTSGSGGSFPRGLLIGEVNRVENIAGELFLDCEITPSPSLYSPTVVGVLLPASPPLPPVPYIVDQTSEDSLPEVNSPESPSTPEPEDAESISATPKTFNGFGE